MSSLIILDAAKEVLAQGEALLVSLDDVTYATPVPQAFNASLGAHYRHCLDHFCSVLDGLAAGEADYDARRRDERIETIRDAALAKTRELRHLVEALPDSSVDQLIRARSQVSCSGGESPLAGSTIGRELMFCIVHAIHHYALMGVMCGLLDVAIPAGFGIAPSTLQHNKEASRLAA